MLQADWHDWAELAARAEKLFGGVQDSALVAALRNVTRAKFRQAVVALTETRTASTAKKTGNSCDPNPPALAARFHAADRGGLAPLSVV